MARAGCGVAAAGQVAALCVALAGPVAAESGLPLDLGGPFALTDQDGRVRTEADPGGRPQLLFFGYAACEQICSVALPTMAEAALRLAEAGLPVTPVMITIDPARDTAEVLARKLRALHPDFIGLTGDVESLARAYDAFQVESEPVYTDPFTGEVFAHGSFIHLLDAEGHFLTLFPPILAPARIEEIVRSHVAVPARG